MADRNPYLSKEPPPQTSDYLRHRLDGARDLYLLALALGDRPDGSPLFGRMIREARIHFAAVIEENMKVLREYHQALKERNPEKIEEMRDIIAGCDAFRKIVKDEIVAHQAQHKGLAQEVPLRKADSL